MSTSFYRLGKLQLSVVLLIAALVVISAVYSFLSSTKAAALTSVKDVLSSSQPSATSTHTITFVHVSGIAAAAGSKTITIDFGTTTKFSVPTGATSTDVTIATSTGSNCETATYNNVPVSNATSASGAWSAVFSTSTTNLLTLTSAGLASTSIGANTCVRVVVGNATGTRYITNPAKSAAIGTSDVYTIAIAGTSGDSGNTLVAIIEGVTVSATVAESLTFTISGVTSGNCVEGKGGSGYTATSTTSSTVPFGQLTADAFTQGCQDILIKTNAPSGFNLTTRTSSSLQNANGNTIPDTDCDGEDCTINAATTWTTATDYGFGYSCDSGGSTDACNATFSTSTVFRSFSSSTAVSVASSSAATSINGNTQRILYKVGVSAAQQSGSYTTVVTWVASPAF